MHTFTKALVNLTHCATGNALVSQSPSLDDFHTPECVQPIQNNTTSVGHTAEKTGQNAFPLPRIDALLDQLGRSHYFSTLDLASGYWQIYVHHQSISKTAFITPQGSFEFRITPFGLTSALSVFQRLMQQVLQDLNPEDGLDFVLVYIYDVLVFSRNLDDHLKHLKLVIDRPQTVQMPLYAEKLNILATSLHPRD